MKCPSCKLIFSDKNDLCPRCHQDVRGVKESLGLQVGDISASVDDLKKKVEARPVEVKAVEVKAVEVKPEPKPELIIEKVEPVAPKPIEPVVEVKDADELMFALDTSVKNISQTAEAVSELQFDLEVSDLEFADTFEPLEVSDEPEFEISLDPTPQPARDPQTTIQMLAELLAEHLKTTPEKVLKDLETLHAKRSISPSAS